MSEENILEPSDEKQLMLYISSCMHAVGKIDTLFAEKMIKDLQLAKGDLESSQPNTLHSHLAKDVDITEYNNICIQSLQLLVEMAMLIRKKEKLLNIAGPKFMHIHTMWKTLYDKGTQN